MMSWWRERVRKMGLVTELDAGDSSQREKLAALLDKAMHGLAGARPFAKASHQTKVLDVARRLSAQEGGVEALYARIPDLDRAGIFAGSDWEHPMTLQPGLAASTLWHGTRHTAMLEYLNELRFLAVANGDLMRGDTTEEQARHFLSQVLALNLSLLFDGASEAERVQASTLGASVRNLYQYLAERVGLEGILDKLIEEIWRILDQRPIQVDSVKVMIGQIATCIYSGETDLGGAALGGAGLGADRLISALYAPTQGCREDPGLDVYAERIANMDTNALSQEAGGFARAMHDTGLVSPYHAVFLRFIIEDHSDLLPSALGLSSTGQESLSCYRELISTLILEAVYPETSQCVYGLALMLERGILFMPPIAPGLWRHIALHLSAETADLIASVYGNARPARVYFLAGMLNVIGQPFGIGQGNNPTCQAARAISMWAHNDPDYLMQMVVWAARDNEVVMHFEGQAVSSKTAQALPAHLPPRDVDPVSLVLVPHLDRIYAEMGRLCADRPGDPHQWINPEFHGWWVGRGCRIAVDVPTGKLADYESFVRDFVAIYHPIYNGNRPLIHPQPAGIAVTDSMGRFIGWHAITITRVTLDLERVMRVYFFNPNNDSGQNWGFETLVSTQGNGEQYGESSLPIEQFASRLYLFHYDPLDQWAPETVAPELVADITAKARESWAAER